MQGYFLSHPSIEILRCKALCVNCKRAVKEQYGRVRVGQVVLTILSWAFLYSYILDYDIF